MLPRSRWLDPLLIRIQPLRSPRVIGCIRWYLGTFVASGIRCVLNVSKAAAPHIFTIDYQSTIAAKADYYLPRYFVWC